MTSGPNHFSIPADERHSVTVHEPGREPFAVPTVLRETLWDLAPHPDGVLVRVGRVVGKITRLDSGSWSYSEVTDWRDLELAGVDREAFWMLGFHGPRPGDDGA